MPAETPRPLGLFFVALFVAALGLNWLWETVQMGVYAQMGGRPWHAIALLHIVPVLGDVAVTFAICGMGALAAGDDGKVDRLRDGGEPGRGLRGRDRMASPGFGALVIH